MSVNQTVMLTAIPEEYNAIRSYFTNLKEEQYKGTIYEKGPYMRLVSLSLKITKYGL